MSELILGIGSNLRDPLFQLSRARQYLTNHFGPVRLTSSVYASAPWGFKTNHWFVNQVLIFNVTKEEEEVLDHCMVTEKLMGRKRKSASGYADRLIDIDILLYGEQITHSDELIIPHPKMHLRNFVLVPLTELRPDIVHPVIKRTIRELTDSCEDNQEVLKITRNQSDVLLP